MRSCVSSLPALLLAISCTRITPPAPATPRLGTTVNASFGRSWDATVDAFAQKGISIETLDRASGLIVPVGRSYVGNLRDGFDYADCGTGPLKAIYFPSSVKYNVVVRGDSSTSVVQVRAFYLTESRTKCSSKGLFESEAEAAIKNRAEAKS